MNGEWIEVGDKMDSKSISTRLMSMFSLSGCSLEEERYWGPRFFWINRYIGAHMALFQKEGLVIIHDDELCMTTQACQKAVLEAFDKSPIPRMESIDLHAVVARGKILLKTGFSE